MKEALVIVLPAFFVTCSETVDLDPGAEQVETINQAYLRGDRAEKCKKVGDFDVSTRPAEIPGAERHTVAEIKARNEARRLEATHVLLWPAKEFFCRKDGTPDEESERVCVEQPATAYQCLIGRGT